MKNFSFIINYLIVLFVLFLTGCNKFKEEPCVSRSLVPSTYVCYYLDDQGNRFNNGSLLFGYDQDYTSSAWFDGKFEVDCPFTRLNLTQSNGVLWEFQVTSYQLDPDKNVISNFYATRIGTNGNVEKYLFVKFI